MPRIAGQIDVAKNEAILDAAIAVMAERGAAASMAEIARRARVSKQTIYNHYGSRAELVRAIAQRRSHEMTAALDDPAALEQPAEALAGIARAVMRGLLNPRGAAILRMAILGALTAPEVGQVLFEAGPLSTRQRLAGFLEAETRAGRLATPDPFQAAEFFMGMVIGSRQTAALVGMPSTLTEPMIEPIAREVAERFLRAYAL